LLTALTGERSEAVVVLTTLVVAAAFTPVKNLLQTVVDRYVKEAPDPTKPMHALGERVQSVVELLDSPLLCQRLLEEAVAAFGSKGGVVTLHQWQGTEIVHEAGDWDGHVALSVPIECGEATLGTIALAPRLSGQEYTASDVELLQRNATLAARAIVLVRGTTGSGGSERSTS
jgi:hypothetical protein